MSVVTTVVFVTESYDAAKRFEAIIREGYTRYDAPYEVKPTEQDGPKYGPGEVYYYGFNYLDQQVLDALHAEPWPPGTVVWIYDEFKEGPEIRVGTQEVYDAGYERGWWNP